MLRNHWIIIFLLGLSAVLNSCVGEDFIEVDPTQTPRVVIFGQGGDLDSLLVGSSKQYTAAYFNEYGFKTENPISWTSMNPQIADVNGDGLISGRSRGITQISASSSGQTTTQSIQIYSIERVEISTPKTYVFLNDSLQLSAQYFDENNQAQTASISWSSLIPSVASINSNGLIRANAKGQTSITATANGIVSDPFFITVVDDSNAVASVKIVIDTNKLNRGDAYQFVAEVRNGFGDISQSLVNWSSSDSTIVSVNANGLVTALQQGVADITASSEGVNSPATQVAVLETSTGFRQGSFVNENGYSVSGDVEIRPSASNNFELKFTNFNCQPGPALYINMSNSNSTAGVEITLLPQLTGDFTVQLPANIQLNDYDYVLIWCKSANAAFGSALLD